MSQSSLRKTRFGCYNALVTQLRFNYRSLHVTVHKYTHKLEILTGMTLTSSEAETQTSPNNQTFWALFSRTCKSLTLELMCFIF